MSDYNTSLQSNNETLSSNNTLLRTVIEQASSLPDSEASASTTGVGQATEGGGEIFNDYGTNIASSAYSSARGWGTVAEGTASSAEGFKPTAHGFGSHAEGYSHSDYEIDFSLGATVSNDYTLPEGELDRWLANRKTSTGTFDEGNAEGFQTLYTLAGGSGAHAEGLDTLSLGRAAHSEGNYTVAKSMAAHAEGSKTVAGEFCAHAEGEWTEANGSRSHAEGLYTIANRMCQHVQGKHNNPETLAPNTYGTYAHMVGCGTAEAPSNIHTVSWQGVGYFLGGTSTVGADYAELFEWEDGNPDNEDRIGFAVTLEDDKIRLAQCGDDVLGIISGTTAVLGDSAESEWKYKYQTDEFGRTIWDMVEEFEEIQNEETGETVKVSHGYFPCRRLNPDYNSEEEYIPRENRKEWAKVGLVGKIYTRDDGTCVVGGYGTVGDNGVLTYSSDKTNIRIMKRTADNIVLVFIK